ncbi:hypothetical protein BGZ79_000871 [Entomortierella chlamydospora]|nr:hypothetical protein BGZ79_000871 [Entomortierella chlamydospora]
MIAKIEPSQLPNEILEHIFLLLSRHSQLACLTVCKRWYSTALLAIYRSIPDSALVRKSSSLASFEKHAHLIKEIWWGQSDPSDPSLDAVKQFLFQSGQLQEKRGNNRLRLTSLTYHGFTGHQDRPFLMKLFKHQPTLTKICLLGSIGITVRLSLDVILECLPNLTQLHVSQYYCEPSDISRWAIQDDADRWNKTLIKEIKDEVMENTEIDTTANNAISSVDPPTAPVRQPFALQKLSFSNVFRSIVDYEIFFGALSNLVSLYLHTEALPKAWSSTTPYSDTSDTISAHMPWNETMAVRLSNSLIRNCPNLQKILIRDNFCTAKLDLPCDNAIGTRHDNPRDTRAQFETLLPKIMRDFRESSFRYSRASLNWMIHTCGSGFTEMNISRPPHWSGSFGASFDDIKSRDLQNVLESCPNLTRFIADGRVLYVKDMAPLTMFTNVDLTQLNDNHSSSKGESSETRPKPWACSRTLERLEIGIMADTDDPDEHKKAWTQLGQVKNCSAIELSKTNLIPRLSHGIGMLGDMKLLYAFLIKRWEATNKPAKISMDESRDVDETGERRKAMLLDSETVVWIARHWTNLLILELDTSGVEELKDEMRALIEKERNDGRMRVVRLQLT